MKYFLTKVRWMSPYPKESNYRIEASNIGLGLYRAFKKFRQENKGRRIKELNVFITEYATKETI